MPGYLVRWSMLITADTPEAAAREAAILQRDPSSQTTVFDVSLAYDPGVWPKVWTARVSVPHPVVTCGVTE